MSRSNDIAIIGMITKVPGADTLWEFEDLLRNKQTAISQFDHFSGNNPESWLGLKGIVNHSDSFEYPFFKLSEKEAKQMDPQHRVLIESAWQALESAGYHPKYFPNRKVGVFASCSANFNHLSLIKNSQNVTEFLEQYNQLLAVDKDYLATRVSYLLNLTGPSFTVQSGCSSSLVALHLAKQSLLLNESDMALVGAVSIPTPLKSGYFAAEGMIFSPSGKCQPYSSEADGIVGGSGCIVLVLKRLQDAVDHKDAILGIIKGSAVNNDGADKMCYTAPSVDQQIAAMHSALLDAQVDPQDVTYIEGHGTGTFLGDAVELEALNKVYGIGSQPCYIGSVKANIGHLDVASGLAGISKVLLSFSSKAIFGQPNLSRATCFLDDKTRLKVAKDSIPFVQEKTTLAAVSSLGVGGTNVHVLLASNSNKVASFPIANPLECEFIFSGRDHESMMRFKTQFKRALLNYDDKHLNDISQTLKARFSPGEINEKITARHLEDLIDKITNNDVIQLRSHDVEKVMLKGAKSHQTILLPAILFKIMNVSRVLEYQRTFSQKPIVTKQNINERFFLMQTIADVWVQILGGEKNEISKDNFFSCGGNSLLALQFIQKLNKRLNITLSAVNLYDYPTIESLTNFVFNQQDIKEYKNEETYSEL